MPTIPSWRLEPEPVLIPCHTIKEGKGWLLPDELAVQFRMDGEEYTSFVPARFVDRERSGLMAAIIADCEDSWLVDIPVETLTSGPRILVPAAEKERVIRVNDS